MVLLDEYFVLRVPGYMFRDPGCVLRIQSLKNPKAKTMLLGPSCQGK